MAVYILAKQPCEALVCRLQVVLFGIKLIYFCCASWSKMLKKKHIRCAKPALPGAMSVCKNQSHRCRGHLLITDPWYLDRGEICKPCSFIISRNSEYLHIAQINVFFYFFGNQSSLKQVKFLLNISPDSSELGLRFQPKMHFLPSRFGELLVLPRFLCTVLDPLLCPQFYFWRLTTQLALPLFSFLLQTSSLCPTHTSKPSRARQTHSHRAV